VYRLAVNLALRYSPCKSARESIAGNGACECKDDRIAGTAFGSCTAQPHLLSLDRAVQVPHRKVPLCEPWIRLPSCSMKSVCWLLLLKKSTLTSHRPERFAAGGSCSGSWAAFLGKHSINPVRNNLSSPGCIIQAVTEMEVVPGSGSLPRRPPPAPLPRAIRGCFWPNPQLLRRQ